MLTFGIFYSFKICHFLKEQLLDRPSMLLGKLHEHGTVHIMKTELTNLSLLISFSFSFF